MNVGYFLHQTAPMIAVVINFEDRTDRLLGASFQVLPEYVRPATPGEIKRYEFRPDGGWWIYEDFDELLEDERLGGCSRSVYDSLVRLVMRVRHRAMKPTEVPA